MDVMGGCWVVVAILAASTIGCVGLLGLDHGIPEDPDASADADVPDGPAPELEASSDHASATDGATSREDASREDAGELDVATPPDVADDHPTDAPLAGDAADAAPTCRPALQPCQAGTDCCSGVCGAGLTCL